MIISILTPGRSNHSAVAMDLPGFITASLLKMMIINGNNDKLSVF